MKELSTMLAHQGYSVMGVARDNHCGNYCPILSHMRLKVYLLLAVPSEPLLLLTLLL